MAEENKESNENIADECKVCGAATVYKDSGNWEAWDCPKGCGAYLLPKNPKPFWKPKGE